MEQTKTKNCEMIEQLYKNVKMGSDSIIKLMSKISDGNFKTELTNQLNGYEKFASQAKDMLHLEGIEAKEENVMTKMWASIGMTMNTLTDSSDSHIAQMVVEGSTMGVTDTIKLLREYENTDVSEKTLALAREIIKFEEENIEKMKSHI